MPSARCARTIHRAAIAPVVLLISLVPLGATAQGPVNLAGGVTVDAPDHVLVGDEARIHGLVHETATGQEVGIPHQPVEVRVACPEEVTTHDARTGPDGRYEVDRTFGTIGICTVRATAWPGTLLAVESDPAEVEVGGDLTAAVLRYEVCVEGGDCTVHAGPNATVEVPGGSSVDVTTLFGGRLSLAGTGVPHRTIDLSLVHCSGSGSGLKSCAAWWDHAGTNATGHWRYTTAGGGDVAADACLELERRVHATHGALSARGAGELRLCGTG